MTLRTRLTLGAVVGAAITLALLIAAFNILLDARMRADADSVLRERAATVLRGLGAVDGRLSVIDAPDRGAFDARTWIFAGTQTLEQPAGADPANRAAARALTLSAPAFATVGTVDSRLYAVPVRGGTQRLGTVVVGTSLAPYESTASSALLGSVILGVIALAAVAALSLWLIGRALRPVARMTAEAADWGEHDLSRRFYPGEPHDELTTLASVLDGLLGRVSQSLRREQRLTAEVSHELRTPLSKILAEAELATSRDRPAHEYRQSLGVIRRYAGDLQRVLETLIASARAASSASSGTSDARTAAERALAPVRDTLEHEGKTVELVCAQPVKVAAETDVVERILSPLLENAARFALHAVSVEITAIDGEAVFDVSDDGPGVNPADRERIFEPGVSVGGGEHGTDSGAGLGLPLVRRLAGSAGGAVNAAASRRGGRFTVRLPRG
jgi:signal transduction histidine kinase